MALEGENSGAAAEPDHPHQPVIQVRHRLHPPAHWTLLERVTAGLAVSPRRVLFSSSVLNLCELVALRPDLARLKKVLYFHENQLVYPVRKDQERDFQYGYNQVLSW